VQQADVYIKTRLIHYECGIHGDGLESEVGKCSLNAAATTEREGEGRNRWDEWNKMCRKKAGLGTVDKRGKRKLSLAEVLGD